MAILRNSNVKVRKSTYCTGYALVYPVGTTFQKIVANEGTGLETWAYCPTCQLYWRRHLGPDDWISDGDLLIEDENGWELIRSEIGAPRGVPREHLPKTKSI